MSTRVLHSFNVWDRDIIQTLFMYRMNAVCCCSERGSLWCHLQNMSGCGRRRNWMMTKVHFWQGANWVTIDGCQSTQSTNSLTSMTCLWGFYCRRNCRELVSRSRGIHTLLFATWLGAAYPTPCPIIIAFRMCIGSANLSSACCMQAGQPSVHV